MKALLILPFLATPPLVSSANWTNDDADSFWDGTMDSEMQMVHMSSEFLVYYNNIMKDFFYYTSPQQVYNYLTHPKDTSTSQYLGVSFDPGTDMVFSDLTDVTMVSKHNYWYKTRIKTSRFTRLEVVEDPAT
jgi:hypothetical protein